MTTRLTKKAVLDEVRSLRDMIRFYTLLSNEELAAEYAKKFPSSVVYRDSYNRSEEPMTYAKMLSALLLSATYHLTNVLNLE